MFTTHMAVLESFNPSLDVRLLTTCSRGPLRGAESLPGSYSSQTATGAGLMESVESVNRLLLSGQRVSMGTGKVTRACHSHMACTSIASLSSLQSIAQGKGVV